MNFFFFLKKKLKEEEETILFPAQKLYLRYFHNALNKIDVFFFFFFFKRIKKVNYKPIKIIKIMFSDIPIILNDKKQEIDYFKPYF